MFRKTANKAAALIVCALMIISCAAVPGYSLDNPEPGKENTPDTTAAAETLGQGSETRQGLEEEQEESSQQSEEDGKSEEKVPAEITPKKEENKYFTLSVR